MKNNTYKDKSTESLLKLEKTTIIATYAFAGILTVLFIVIVLLTIKKGFTPLLIVPFSLLPIFALNASSLKKIRPELSTRKAAL